MHLMLSGIMESERYRRKPNFVSSTLWTVITPCLFFWIWYLASQNLRGQFAKCILMAMCATIENTDFMVFFYNMRFESQKCSGVWRPCSASAFKFISKANTPKINCVNVLTIADPNGTDLTKYTIDLDGPIIAVTILNVEIIDGQEYMLVLHDATNAEVSLIVVGKPPHRPPDRRR